MPSSEPADEAVPELARIKKPTTTTLLAFVADRDTRVAIGGPGSNPPTAKPRLGVIRRLCVGVVVGWFVARSRVLDTSEALQTSRQSQNAEGPLA